MSPIAISIAHADANTDDVLHSILKEISDPPEEFIREPASRNGPPRPPPHEDLAQVVIRLTRSFQNQGEQKTLDLIGHASGGLLQIGQWLIHANDPDFQNSLMGVIAANSGISQIRLLGCLTAGTEQGVETLRALQGMASRAQSTISVVGCVTHLHASHFNAKGIKSGAARERLRKANELSLLLDIQTVLMEFWRELREPNHALLRLHRLLSQKGLGIPKVPLRRESVAQVRASNALYGDLIPIKIGKKPAPDVYTLSEEPGRRVVGLLELPMGELLIPVDDSPLHHRVTLLFDGAFARIYPLGDLAGVTYRVEKPERLRGSFLEGTNAPP